MFKEIDELKKKLPRQKDGKILIFNSFYENYHLNFILQRENNYLEIDGHHRDFSISLLKKFSQKNLSEDLIQEIDFYRKDNVEVLTKYYKKNSAEVLYEKPIHKFPEHEKISLLMQNFMNDLCKKEFKHVIEKAAFFHMNFVNIHPFLDKNGRTARFFTNVILYDGCFLPIRPAIEAKFRLQFLLKRLDFDRFDDDFDVLDYQRVVFLSQKTGNNSYFIKYLIEMQKHEISAYLRHRNFKISC